MHIFYEIENSKILEVHRLAMKKENGFRVGEVHIGPPVAWDSLMPGKGWKAEKLYRGCFTVDQTLEVCW